jgi:hypothetical protein
MGMTRTSSSIRYHMASAAQVRILPLSRDFFFCCRTSTRAYHLCAFSRKCGERRERVVEECSDLPTWISSLSEANFWSGDPSYSSIPFHSYMLLQNIANSRTLHRQVEQGRVGNRSPRYFLSANVTSRAALRRVSAIRHVVAHDDAMAAFKTPDSTPRLPRVSFARNGSMSSSAALEAVASRPRRLQRRPTQAASYELANHAKAYIEGNQRKRHCVTCVSSLTGHAVTNAYEFLYSLLAVGTSISTPAQPYVGFLPPPSHIALASSLVAFTHRKPSAETSKSSDAALRYLQCVLATID